MSSIVRQRVRRHIYLYESTSYRNKEGKPRNRRVLIGKIDPVTDTAVYKPAYLERMAGAGRSDATATSAVFSVKDVQHSTIKEYGAFYLFQSIAGQIGLQPCLQRAFPHCWRELFTLACYLVSSGDAFLYCEDWEEHYKKYFIHPCFQEKQFRLCGYNQGRRH